MTDQLLMRLATATFWCEVLISLGNWKFKANQKLIHDNLFVFIPLFSKFLLDYLVQLQKDQKILTTAFNTLNKTQTNNIFAAVFYKNLSA